jgi:hypothetical protein
MKSLFRSTISIVLGVMILLTGSGVSLAKMVCIKSGYMTISVSQPDDCCKHEHDHAPVTLEEKCCDVSSMHVAALQFLIASSHNIEKSFVAIELPAALSSLGFDQSNQSVSLELRRHGTFLASSYPPIRIFTRTFLI